MTYNAEDFTRMALAEFPELGEEFAEGAELLHLKMGAFGRITQGAKGDGDWEKYDRCVRLADELFGRATPDLENALNVSYLEHLDFDGPRGPNAWERLTPRLKVGWKEMQDYLEDLAARGSWETLDEGAAQHGVADGRSPRSVRSVRRPDGSTMTLVVDGVERGAGSVPALFFRGLTSPDVPRGSTIEGS